MWIPSSLTEHILGNINGHIHVSLTSRTMYMYLVQIVDSESNPELKGQLYSNTDMLRSRYIK